MPIETLTDARVRSAAPPETGILELWDGKTSGLCFRVMKSGVRSWTFRYRPHSGAAFRRVTLGRYPALSLVEARGAAERLRDRVRTGADPQQEQRDRPRGAAGGAGGTDLRRPRRSLHRALRQAAEGLVEK